MAMIRGGADQLGGHDGAQPDRACAEDGERAPGSHPQGIHDRAGSRLNAASPADTTRQWHVLVDLHDVAFSRDGVGGE